MEVPPNMDWRLSLQWNADMEKFRGKHSLRCLPSSRIRAIAYLTVRCCFQAERSEALSVEHEVIVTALGSHLWSSRLVDRRRPAMSFFFDAAKNEMKMRALRAVPARRRNQRRGRRYRIVRQCDVVFFL